MEYNVEVTVSPAAMAKLASGAPEIDATSLVLIAGRMRRLVRAAELLDDGSKEVGGKGGEKRRAREVVLQVGVSGFISLPDDEDTIRRVILDLAPIRILGVAIVRNGAYVRHTKIDSPFHDLYFYVFSSFDRNTVSP